MNIRNTFLLLFAFILFSCPSDDDNANTVQDIEPTITLDVDAALARPPLSDITDLVDFGQPAGTSSGDWEVELEVGQSLKLGQPVNLTNGDVLLYSRSFFFENDPAGPGLIQIDTSEVFDNWIVPRFAAPGSADAVESPIDPIPGRSISRFYGYDVIDAQVSEALEYKYELRVAILRNGTLNGYYTIDPKLKIRAKEVQ